MKGCLYDLKVIHKRLKPQINAFSYRTFMFCLNIDEMDRLNELHPLVGRNTSALYSFYDRDHFDESDTSVRKKLIEFLLSCAVQELPESIYLVTNLRFLNYVFNPVCFYFCFAQNGKPLYSVAEVSNTFGEKKAYLIPVVEEEIENRKIAFKARIKKLFYVSPFSELDIDFEFRLNLPGEVLAAFVDDLQGENRIFLSSLTGRRVALTRASVIAQTFKHPLVTLKVISMIHWEALRLFLKKVPHFKKETDPEKQTRVMNPHKSITNPDCPFKRAIERGPFQ